MKSLKPLKWAGVVLGALVAAFAYAQLARPERTKLQTEPSHTIQTNLATSRVGPVVDRACGECHSNYPISRGD